MKSRNVIQIVACVLGLLGVSSSGGKMDQQPRVVRYSDIPERVQITGKVGQPLGQLVTVRGEWIEPFPSKPARPLFVVSQLNGRLFDLPAEFRDVEPVWEKDVEFSKQTTGEEWEIRAVETGGFVGFSNEVW